MPISRCCENLGETGGPMLRAEKRRRKEEVNAAEASANNSTLAGPFWAPRVSARHHHRIAGRRDHSTSLLSAAMKWLTRNFETVVPFLLVVTTALVLATFIKNGWLTLSLLAANKDSLIALNNAATIVAIVVGGFFSYYRFFRGRIFFRRAEASLSVVVVGTSLTLNIPAVTLKVKNIGSLAIWDPVPVVQVYQFGPAGNAHETWDNWQEARSPLGDEGGLSLIDFGETVTFINNNEVDKSIWAVEYVAFVHAHGGEVWKCASMVANLPEAGANQDRESP